jgi:hypothetical protein
MVKCTLNNQGPIKKIKWLIFLFPGCAKGGRRKKRKRKRGGGKKGRKKRRS